MAAGSFSRHHNGGDPYWSRVIDVAEELRSSLRNIARGKKWETEANRFDLIGMAQAIVITEDVDKEREETDEEKALRQPSEETAEQKALRLSARDFERALLGYRAAVMRAKRWRGDPEDYELLDGLKDDLAVARRYAWPLEMPPAVFIARRIVDSLLQANRLARLRRPVAPDLPTGLGSTGIVVGLTCEALERINRKKNPDAKSVDPVAIRKELTKHRSQLGV